MISESPNSIHVQSWKGLAPDVLNASLDHNRSGKNFILDAVPGELTVRNGLTSLYLTGLQPYSQLINNGANYAEYTAQNRRSQENIVAVESFFVPTATGNRLVRVAIMKYRMRAMTAAQEYRYTYGTFVRPFYDPDHALAAADGWVDGWRDLMEFWDFKIYGRNSTDNTGTGLLNWLQLDTLPYAWHFGNNTGGVGVFPTDPPTGTGIENQYYFRGWTVENLEAAKDKKRFCRALQTRLTLSLEDVRGYYIFEMRVPDDGTANCAFDRLDWQVNDRIRVHRNYVYMQNRISNADDIVVSPTLYSLDDGLRFSNGIGTNKARFRVGYEKMPLGSNDKFANGIIVADQCIDPFPPTLFLGVVSVGGGGGTLSTGNYRIRYAVREGRNWSKLYRAPIYDAGNARYDASNTDAIAVAAGQVITCSLSILTATLSRAAKAVRLYVEDDSDPGNYWQHSEIDLSTLSNVSQDDIQNSYYDGTHTWKIFGITHTHVIREEATGALAQVDIGRPIEDDGVAYYVAASPIGRKVAFANIVRANGNSDKTNIYVSVPSGDGAIQSDIISTDPLNFIEVVTGDGSGIVALAPFDDRAMGLSGSAMVLISLAGTKDQWAWDVVSTEDGIASRLSLTMIDDFAYFAGQHGIWRYSPSTGRQLLNPGWVQTYKNIADKTGILAGYDKLHGQYGVYIGNTLGRWCFFPTLTEKTGLLSITDGLLQLFNKTPVWISKSPDGLFFATADNFMVHHPSAAVRDYGADIDAEFETREYQLQEATQFDMNLWALRILYESSVPVTVEVYREGALWATRVASISKTAETFLMPLGGLCKRFHLKLKATITADGQSCRIKGLTMTRELIPQGGDILR